ncbi:CDC48 like AAA ATPase [Cryptosporidium ubiquitum]|uniref:CDC48 like AAA ATPase n=1 Tax=Cryptosporidium ubiquitum TaxID=857276 RepID=A0A1J4MMH5_9CRYT|nr:CDC48 like AAA ATPase [Cryptosporidium ubiquitum]OII74659.1 CDC48 like AAA ATPase [Cryptosporidium ubiquitum]
MMSFQNIPIIPVVFPKIELLNRFNKLHYFKRKYIDDTHCCNIEPFKNESKNLRMFNKPIYPKVKPPNICLVNCKASSIPIKDFKEFVNSFSTNSNDGTQCHPVFNETNDSVKIGIKLRSGNIAKKISNFLEIINENCSNVQNSTVINNWEILDDINGKRITIEINSLNDKGIINIQIPSEKSLPVNLEYIKSKNSLSKNDLDAIHFLMKPTNDNNKFEEKNLFNKYSFSNGQLYGKNHLEREIIGHFEQIFDSLNKSIFSNTLFNNLNNAFNSREYKSNMFDQYSGKSEFLTTNNDSNTCNNGVISLLEDLGVQVFFNRGNDYNLGKNSWDCLGGYEEVKRQIEEHILLNFKYPDVIDKIVNGTRIQKDSVNRPKLILFEGPPGTGKTTSARIISNTIEVPLIYVSLENIVSKWYGESENRLAQIFDTAKKFEKGCIIFIDEIDTLASSRDKTFSMHEGSKKILSVLLRKLDGFDTLNSKTLLICATNRKRDIDEAFLNRIDSTVFFNLPNENEREVIFKQYAKHLTFEERMVLAKMSKKLSGRSIRHVCLEAEREWASRLLKKKEKGECQKEEIELPTVEVYKEALKKRVN